MLWPWGKDIYARVQLQREIISDVVDLRDRDLLEFDLDEVEMLARDSLENLSGLQEDLEPLYMHFDRYSSLPIVGLYLSEVKPALQFGIQVSMLGEDLSAAIRPFWEMRGDQINKSELSDKAHSLLDSVGQSHEQLSAQLEAVQDAREKINPDIWPEKYRRNLQLFDSVIAQLEEGLDRGKVIHSRSIQTIELAKQAMKFSQSPLLEIDIDEAATLANKLHTNLELLQEDLELFYPYLHEYATDPELGPYLSQVEPALQFGLELSKLAEQLAAASAPFWTLLDEGQRGFDLSRAVIKAIDDSSANFEAILHQFDLVRQLRNKLNPSVLPQEYQDEMQRLDVTLEKLESGLRDVRLLPDLLGAEKPKTYLIMVQNRDELRATGGFITSFGLLRLENGRISMLRFESSGMNWVMKVLQPPDALAYLMHAHYWVARDANWSPDFPTAARQTQELYFLSTGISTDGVIAFDEQLLKSMLDFTGPVDVPGEFSEISSGNIREEMISFMATHAEKGYEQKEFMTIFSAPLLEKLIKINDSAQLADMASLLQQMIEEGHLLLYMQDNQAQTVLERRGFDGKVDPGERDYLMLIDSNVGWSKVDMYIQRSLRYQVDLSELHKPQGVITLDYQHTQPGDEPCYQEIPTGLYRQGRTYYFSRCYWDYWRVYLPGGTKLTGSDIPIVPASWFYDGVGWPQDVDIAPGENGATMMSGLVVVPQNDSRQIVMEVDLPTVVVDTDFENQPVYTLRVQKQAGIESLPIEIEIIVPVGYIPTFNGQGWENLDQITYQWNGEITRSMDFVVEFVRTPKAPLVIND